MEAAQVEPKPERLDRELQRTLLNSLADQYPQKAGVLNLGFAQTDPAAVRNLTYLAEHGLVELDASKGIGGPPAVVLARITARGMDFLAEDGGLSAILGTVTVRFEAETLRAILEARIDASDAPLKEKSLLKEGLRKMGEEGLKTAAKSLMELAWKNAPAALDLMKTVVQFQL